MLSLQLKSGEYITIGKDIVVQVFRDGAVSRIAVKAPRELPILRGDVLERTENRPEGLRTRRPKTPSEVYRNAAQMEKLAARRALFEEERRQEEQKRAALVQELKALADQIDGLASVQDCTGIQGKINDLRSRLDNIMENPDTQANEAGA